MGKKRATAVKLQNKPAEARPAQTAITHVVARDEKGRILPGHTGNPGGRPKAATLAMEALEDNTGKLMKKAIELALDGDRILLMFLLPYKLGRPSHKLELTGSGGGPVKVSSVRAQLADRLARLLVKEDEPEDAELVDDA